MERTNEAIRPTIIVPENKTGFFNTVAGFSSRGRQKTSPAPSMGYWSNFRNLVGLAAFAGSKFQRMANWPSFDFFIETGRLFRIIIFFNRNWINWPSIGIRACKIG